MAERGLSGAQASAALLEQGVAATSMENWGEADIARYLRLVFANEPLERLREVPQRFARAFATFVTWAILHRSRCGPPISPRRHVA